ncbi:hypothetical protein [Shinella sp.]|uniref:hypothetical protein n=1 Tax=Shinella sp. TaxID=1870904 RepID=UPI004035647C
MTDEIDHRFIWFSGLSFRFSRYLSAYGGYCIYGNAAFSSSRQSKKCPPGTLPPHTRCVATKRAPLCRGLVDDAKPIEDGDGATQLVFDVGLSSPFFLALAVAWAIIACACVDVPAAMFIPVAVTPAAKATAVVKPLPSSRFRCSAWSTAESQGAIFRRCSAMNWSS